MKNRLIAVVAVLIVCLSVSTLLSGCLMAFGASEKVEYQEVEGGYALFRYSGVSTVDSFEIPDTHEGKPVVEIMEYAVSSADYLKSISIGKNVKTIANWGITNCVALEKIVVSSENPYFVVGDDGILYNADKTVLRLYPNSREKEASVVVPSSVKLINETAFYQCGNLKNITFNEGLEEIGSYAFLKCVGLQNFTLPSTLKKIGKDAFSYCDAITSLTIPYSVTDIGAYAFFSLSGGLYSISVMRTEEQMKEVTLGEKWMPYEKGSLSKPVQILYLD